MFGIVNFSGLSKKMTLKAGKSKSAENEGKKCNHDDHFSHQVFLFLIWLRQNGIRLDETLSSEEHESFSAMQLCNVCCVQCASCYLHFTVSILDLKSEWK
jgi:hypothetical protein